MSSASSGLIREVAVLVVDDNLIGTRPEHIARAKDLFRAMIDAHLRKQWIAQATINFADDEELMSLAARAGCKGVFIGFESLTPDGLRELGKRFNLQGGRDIPASVRRIQRHKIQVAGSFVVGLDVDRAGIGRRVAETAGRYGVDMLNVLFLTPLPGTRLWDQMNAERRIVLNDFPQDWAHYTLGFPVVRYRHLSVGHSIDEVDTCAREFYSMVPHRRAGGARLAGPPPALEQSGQQPRSPTQRPAEPRGACRLQARPGQQVESGYASGVAPQPDESPIVRIAVQ